MSDLSVAASTMVDEVFDYIGGTDSENSWDRADALKFLNRGYSRFLRGTYMDERGSRLTHLWSFLQIYTTVSLAEDEYLIDLPAGFGGLLGKITHQYSSSDDRPETKLLTPADLRDKWRRYGTTETGTPKYFAIQPKALVAATGQRYQLLCYPTADGAYTMDYAYRLLAAPLTDGAVYAYGGADHADVIIQCGLAVAEAQAFKMQRGPMWAKAEELMLDSVNFDRTLMRPHNVHGLDMEA